MYGIILVAVIAIIAGLLLSWASIQFAVPVDEKQAAVREVLPVSYTHLTLPTNREV